jgi:polysaccharide export outer membrane protein
VRIRAAWAALLIAGCCWGQDSTAGHFEIRKNERKITPLDVLREFQGEDAGIYQLGDGDELTIEVWGRPELSGKHVIGPDGRITLPVAGSLELRNLSRDQAAEAVHKALAPYYLDPAVTLRIDRYTSNRVFILGRVANPGALQFESTPTLLDVITRAGALPVGGAGSEKAALNRCAVVQGDRIVWINLKTLLTDGNLAYNIRLRRNDVVYIPDSDDELVYVLGEVQHPGAVRLTPQMTMMDAFAQSGGPTRDAAATHIQLIRPVAGERRTITLKDIVEPKPEINFALQQGDIIYVPRRGMATFGYWMEKLNTIATFGIFGAAVAK